MLTSSDAFGAERGGDVGAVGDQHVDVALHRQHMDLAVLGTLVGDVSCRPRIAERDDGTFRLATLVPIRSASTGIPDRASSRRPAPASGGIQSSILQPLVSASFWPGRKCGTQCRLVPPFSANAEALHVSMRHARRRIVGVGRGLDERLVQIDADRRRR